MTALRLAALALALSAIAACSDDADPVPDLRPDARPSSSAAPTATGPATPAPSASTSGAGRPSPTGAPVVVRRVSGDFTQFRMPSGNVGCAMTSDGAGCELRSAAWAVKRPPAPCGDADWNGRAVSLHRDEVSVGVCATDTVFADSPVLAYGTALESARARCTSRPEGLTCEHLGTGRGFTVSQARLTLF